MNVALNYKQSKKQHTRLTYIIPRVIMINRIDSFKVAKWYRDHRHTSTQSYRESASQVQCRQCGELLKLIGD